MNSIVPPRVLLAVAQNWLDGVPCPGGLIQSRDPMLRAVASTPSLGTSVGGVLTTNWAAVWQYGRLAEGARGIAAQIRTGFDAS